MSLNTNLAGRLRNTNLPKTNVLYPLFEAVVNSIHAIDERISKIKDIDLEDSVIKIKIIRSSQLTTDGTKPDIVGFDIIDNGIGFNEDNYDSFQTLDTDYKIEIGGKGVGRLLWLKTFSKVAIQSYYRENGSISFRSFEFDKIDDIHNEVLNQSPEVEKIETNVQLLNLIDGYKQYLPKTITPIANSLFEHCLWYFLRERGAPSIRIVDGNESLSLQNVYDSFMVSASDRKTIEFKNFKFNLTHVKLKSTSHNKHTIVYSAANRVVKEENLSGKVPGLFGVLNDGKDDFCYKCFVASEYLNKKVNQERINFNISESNSGLFSEEEISLKEIRENVLKEIASYLEEFLSENKKLGIKKVNDFVAKRAPRYRPILNRISEVDKTVDPSISDKDLELKLHEWLMLIESELLAEGHDLMQPGSMDDINEYSTRIEDYLAKASDLKKSDLASYVAHRKVILDLLSKAIEVSNGKYSKEEVIHKLIMPMQKDSNELFSNDSNLWLLDEKLAFHNFLASDKTIKSMPIANSDETKEPDLLALHIYDNPLLVSEGQTLPLASITVVEIKRPMRNDAKEGENKDPIEQALNYLEKIRNGNVKTELGRPIPNSPNIPGFCYIVSDLTPTVVQRCKILNLRITADKMGYFGYNDNYGAYIEVISFDRLLNLAKDRNRAFFDKLGLPTN